MIYDIVFFDYLNTMCFFIKGHANLECTSWWVVHSLAVEQNGGDQCIVVSGRGSTPLDT